MSTVSGISASDSNQINWQNINKQRKAAFQELASALQAGDLSASQKAFSNLQQLQNKGQIPNSDTANTINDDFTALSKALQSGDLNAAKTAFAKLQQDTQAMRTHRHHHHKNVSQVDSDAQNDQNTNDTTSTGNDVNALA